jgi:hypothetical protein
LSRRGPFPSALGFVLGALFACTESREADAAAAERRDRDALAKVIAVDVRASRAMHDADEAAMTGDAGAALDIVAARASPAVDEGLGLLDRAAAESAWGRQKKEAIGGILRDRKAEMPRYADAVRSGEPGKLVDAMRAQAEIERRAVATVADLNRGR